MERSRSHGGGALKPGDALVALRPVTDLLAAPDGPELVTQARLGDAAELLSLTPGWLELRLAHDGHAAWAPAAAFVPGPWPPAGEPVWRVRSLFANLHEEPSVRARLLSTFTLGSPVIPGSPLPRSGGEEMGAGGWLRVRLPGETAGWLLVGDLTPGASAWSWTTPVELRSGVLATARRLLGLPYRWGGNTPFGLDCSGLVQLAYRLHGVELPHNARYMSEDPRTTPVTREAVSAGDLIFFGDYTHVGLAVVPDEFIHATTFGSPGVQLSRLSDSHWSSRLDECRRLTTG